MSFFPYRAEASNFSFPPIAETRDANSYTDARIAATLRDVEGTELTAHKTAAAEACSGLYAACLAGAHVTPSIPALNPAFLSLLARELIRNGEALFIIQLAGDRIELIPAASWDVRGGVVPATWFYRVDAWGPTSTSPTSQIVSGAQVLHFRYSVAPSRPWRGISPLTWASDSGSLAGGLETRLSGEALGPSGYLLPVPADGGSGDESDPMADLKNDLARASGRTQLIETTAAGFDQGPSAAPRADWKSQRYGINIPDSVGNLRDAAAVSVLNACQVPAALFDTADGTSQRESWRRFAMGPLAGLAAIIEAEIKDKLMTPVKLDFSGLWAHDVAGRAQAFNRLVAGGMSIEKAATVSGVLVDND
ncbi:MAG: hypothetical protein OXE42_01280 [Gammaproteobacteria bacterium]|nr:hypothetical protein [Gammaproteobacteria bacterium]